jgi:hypothetical protein
MLTSFKLYKKNYIYINSLRKKTIFLILSCLKKQPLNTNIQQNFTQTNISIFHLTKNFKLFINASSEYSWSKFTNFTNGFFFKNTLLYKTRIKSVSLKDKHVNFYFIYLNKLSFFKLYNSFFFKKNKNKVLFLIKMFTLNKFVTLLYLLN